MSRVAAVGFAVCCIAAAPLPVQPPPPAPGTASDTYFGVKVPDPNRAFENPKNPQLMRYFKAQNAYTHRVLDALPGRALLSRRIAELDGASESLASLTVGRHAYFYLKRPVGASALRLYTRASGVGVSEGGSEIEVLRVVDFRTPKLPPNAPQSTRDTKGVVFLHVLGTDPGRDRAVFGYRYSPHRSQTRSYRGGRSSGIATT